MTIRNINFNCGNGIISIVLIDDKKKGLINNHSYASGLSVDKPIPAMEVGSYCDWEKQRVSQTFSDFYVKDESGRYIVFYYNKLSNPDLSFEYI